MTKHDCTLNDVESQAGYVIAKVCSACHKVYVVGRDIVKIASAPITQTPKLVPTIQDMADRLDKKVPPEWCGNCKRRTIDDPTTPGMRYCNRCFISYPGVKQRHHD